MTIKGPEGDVFEEFDFKPLTDGLGFQKKSINLKKEVVSSGLTDRPLKGVKMMIPEATGLIPDERDPEIKMPLTNKPSAPAPVVELKPSLDLEFEEKTEKKSENPLDVKLEKVPSIDQEILRKTEKPNQINQEVASIEYKRVPSNMVSALFDAVVSLVLTIIFSVSMMMVTQIDLLQVMLNGNNQLMVQLSLGSIYVSVLLLYMIVSRIIAGSTLGEWAFDVHLAKKDNAKDEKYPLLVIWRSLVSLMTGIVVLPFLSFIIRRDLLSFLTGTHLFQRK